MADHPLIQSSTDIEDGCVFGRSDENSTMVPTQSVDVLWRTPAFTAPLRTALAARTLAWRSSAAPFGADTATATSTGPLIGKGHGGGELEISASRARRHSKTDASSTSPCAPSAVRDEMSHGTATTMIGSSSISPA